MKTVLKYQIEETSVTQLKLREGFKLVRFEYVQADKALFAWIEEPLKADIPATDIELKVIRTGEPIHDKYQYLSTALDVIGPEAYHLYQNALEDDDQVAPTDGSDLDEIIRKDELQQVA